MCSIEMLLTGNVNHGILTEWQKYKKSPLKEIKGRAVVCELLI
jgi:hypothetical protein